LLLMLDEFPALGRLDFFETALAFLAGYGVRAFLIAQSLNQIVKAYGENNAILDNCHVRVAFSSNDERTAKRISDALGTATEQRAMRNYAGHRLAPWLAHVMVSRQETSRPLLTPGEVMQLPATDELVLVSGLAPIRAKKLRYFEDRNFRARVARAPVLSSDGYADRPAARADDWTGCVAAAAVSVSAPELADGNDGGLQQARQPGLPKRRVNRAPPEQLDLLGLGDDDADPAIDGHAMDQLRPLAPIVAAHGLNNEGAGHPDLVPGY
ncbi:MAG TPA: type IV secretory system conjugative DNA transfer family protein, partial [Allosphingosinicella sp.]